MQDLSFAIPHPWKYGRKPFGDYTAILLLMVAGFVKGWFHYHIHRLNLQDPHHEFYQEGFVAMWSAYEKYQPDKGTLSTYFNYTIPHRLIDLLRRHGRNYVTRDLRKG